ncbi:hypothetical protein L9F63_008891, partial [Diploptera punctata]
RRTPPQFLFVVSVSVLMRGLPGGLIFCIFPVSSSRFLHFPTVDGCNATNCNSVVPRHDAQSGREHWTHQVAAPFHREDERLETAEDSTEVFSSELANSDEMLGDEPDPVTDFTNSRVARKKSRKKKGKGHARFRRLRTRSHDNQILAASLTHLNSTMVARLDLSCLLSQRRGRGLLKAPELPNSSGLKYT